MPIFGIVVDRYGPRTVSCFGLILSVTPHVFLWILTKCRSFEHEVYLILSLLFVGGEHSGTVRLVAKLTANRRFGQRGFGCRSVGCDYQLKRIEVIFVLRKGVHSPYCSWVKPHILNGHFGIWRQLHLVRMCMGTPQIWGQSTVKKIQVLF